MITPLAKTKAEWGAIAKRLHRGQASRAHVEGAAVGIERARLHLDLWLQDADSPKVSKAARKAILKYLGDERRRYAVDPIPDQHEGEQ